MPLVSVYTPTHKPFWLVAAYQSLLRQTYQNWEWVIVPNNGATAADIPQEIREHHKVRVVCTDAKGVGALKGFAVAECRGELLVELDHDDRLTTDCLASVVEAYKKTPGGFYYSDFVSAFPDGRSELYDKRYGWDHYQVKIDNDDYIAMRAFAPNARALCEIFYAPNHVRAWSRQAYTLAGGYDFNMQVGDDHDLVCRTYIAGAPFVHVPKCLYIYSSHPASTCRVDNATVQAQQRVNMHRYLYPLIYEECKRRDLRMLDFGGGNTTFEQFQRQPLLLDARWKEQTFEPLELNEEADSIGCIWLPDVLQRVHQANLPGLMNELYRALAPGGWLLTVTPAIDDGQGKIGRGAFQDPGHISYWSANSFWYYTHRDYAKHLPDYCGRFQLVRAAHEFPSEWHRANFIPYVRAEMLTLKGQRTAGFSTI